MRAQESRWIRAWKLFYTMLYISAFTFGGGFVIVTLMEQKLVKEYGWLEEEEMLDMTALAQASPGAIAVNASILVGRKMAGTLGIFAAVLGTIIPPFAIISVISYFYEQFATNRYVAAVLVGMQAGVAAVIIHVVLNLGKAVVKQKSVLSMVIMIASFVMAYLLKINVVYIILLCAGIGVAKAIYEKRAKQ